MRRDLFSLFKRVAILGVLGIGVFMVSNTPMTPGAVAADYCQYCDSSHGYCTQYCADDYNNCLLHYPASTCNENLYWCVLSCDIQKTFCQQNCSGGGGGGGGGGRTKTPCEQACYSSRVSCFGNDGIPEAEDCVNEGGNPVFCCNQVFYDCMANCP